MADVIVVLGAALTEAGDATPTIRRRVAHGVALWNEGIAPRLLMAGGPTRHTTPESHVMRDLAVAAGVAADAVHVEDRSTRTLENAANTRDIMAERGWRHAVVVTDPTHLPRALNTFGRLGMAAEGAAAPGMLRDGGPFYVAAVALREAVAMLVYWRRVARFLKVEAQRSRSVPPVQ